MIEIRRIEPNEWFTAKQLIYRVAREVFNDPRPLDELIDSFEAKGELEDMDDIQHNYFENRGTFLVLTQDDRIIGTGAVCQLEDKICELKRLWLLTEYHNKGLGYRMLQELLTFARGMGYERIRLETDPNHQKHAVKLYKRLGFYELPIPNATYDEDILMEMTL